jgi:hypothetical protein
MLVTCFFCGLDPSRAAPSVVEADFQPLIPSLGQADPARMEIWQRLWRQNILTEASARHCETQMGEEIGWLMSPLLNGFYQGYRATGDPRWIDQLLACTDAWVRRGVTEPDGYLGWPKVGAAGTDVDDLNSYDADSLVGEAMVLRPVVLMSAMILQDPALAARYGQKAGEYIGLARSVFEKWDRRGAWRRAGEGMITVVLPFGIDRRAGGWTSGYRDKDSPARGFSHPDNKANLVASWLLAMSDATGEKTYEERAEQWFRLMKSRMTLKHGGGYPLWNYWEPAGPWDYTVTGRPKHWVGVHPNAGYYAIDVGAIVAAYEHGLVFTTDDIRYLIEIAQARSLIWPALVPYSEPMRQRFEASVKPDGWPGLDLIPWYMALRRGMADTIPPFAAP